ncbi:hypothetical protein [Glaciimonas immobilis]|uniref:Uncharacterized protein n=1 Tax=Glaciimonas immobilis TaxID=728004 RepID=A0A840RN55_9BURK|nr:hypothetical protein [Glaciimonas immobilis]KAF3999004.1 hypothetical protein HAV38_03375 [Glaciimonas immobilis]MBB5198426.1 hypothetical protein [Glaciimonas immobilis]
MLDVLRSLLRGAKTALTSARNPDVLNLVPCLDDAGYGSEGRLRRWRFVAIAAMIAAIHSAFAVPISDSATTAGVSGAAGGLATRTLVGSSVAHPAVDLFAKPLVLRGTLGDAKIEMHLQLKPDPTEGLVGTYSAIGQAAQILVAGEYDGGDVLMEESVNGKDVSGEWSGKFNGTTFTGMWSTTDDAITKPFAMTVQIDTSRNKSGIK